MLQVKSLHAREILDSRGNPTIEVDITDNVGNVGRAAVPSGASVGKKEALELRDGGQRYLGKGVAKAVKNVNTIIAQSVIGENFQDQKAFDRCLITMDGTDNKSALGANAILGCSMAFARLQALHAKQPLFQSLAQLYKKDVSYTIPRPMMNILNGGAHADNPLSIQEFMIIPAEYNSIQQVLRMGCEVFHTLKGLLKKRGFATGIGDEGGFAPALRSTQEAIEFVLEAIVQAGYQPGKDILLGLDCAASEFYRDGRYHIDGQNLSSDDMLQFYANLSAQYPIISIEDPFDEFDHAAWQNITSALGNKVQIVGDDLFTTNMHYLQEGIDKKQANAILIKLNQIGTVTETIDTIRLAGDNNFNAIISHRSGETEDAFISHLAVATSWQIKTGSLCRSDRTAKYNELIRIAELLC